VRESERETERERESLQEVYEVFFRLSILRLNRSLVRINV
jgi:hypothetical protein